MEDVVGATRLVSMVKSHEFNNEEDMKGVNHAFNLERMSRQIASMEAISVEDSTQPTSTMIKDESLDPGEADAPSLPAFSSSERDTQR